MAGSDDDDKVVELRPGERKRRRPSSIDLLPKDIRESLNDAIADGRMSVDDLWALVRDKGGEAISRSAVGRYKVREERTLGELREMQRMAEVVTQEAAKDPTGRASQLLGELTKTAIYRRLTAMTPAQMEKLDPRDLNFLAGTVKSLMSADKINAEREAAIRDRAIKEERQRAAKEVEKVARQRGLTKEAVSEIREKILGVAS